jgi:hypothetical protein
LKEVLEEVCTGIASDTDVDEALRDVEVDSDTQGVAGQPPIVETIFKKIDASAVFVADMTFVGARTDGRSTPNPNVLIEYGWALRGLGHPRVICVMNTAYGAPTSESLPFDLRHVRWPIGFNLPDGASREQRAQQRRELVAALKGAIRLSLATIATAPIEPSHGFPAAEPMDGLARFRRKGEPLGFEDDPLFGSGKEVLLSPGPAMWLRVMPVTNPGRLWPPHQLKEAARQNGAGLMPLAASAGGYDYVRAEDGFGIFRAIPQGAQNAQPGSIEISSLAFAFETGEIWSIDSDWLGDDTKRFHFVEDDFAIGLRGHARFLQGLGILPPFRWLAGITGTKGRYFVYPVRPGHIRIHPGLGPRCAADSIEAEGQYDGTQNVTAALLPFFKKIFEKCGLPRPDYLPQWRIMTDWRVLLPFKKARPKSAVERLYCVA